MQAQTHKRTAPILIQTHAVIRRRKRTCTYPHRHSHAVDAAAQVTYTPFYQPPAEGEESGPAAAAPTAAADAGELPAATIALPVEPTLRFRTRQVVTDIHPDMQVGTGGRVGGEAW